MQASTEFYEKLGFKKNVEFSNEQSSSMMWDDTFWIMLLEYDFYNLFLKNKRIADTEKESSTLTAFSVESPDVVKKLQKQQSQWWRLFLGGYEHAGGSNV